MNRIELYDAVSRAVRNMMQGPAVTHDYEIETCDGVVVLKNSTATLAYLEAYDRAVITGSDTECFVISNRNRASAPVCEIRSGNMYLYGKKLLPDGITV